MGKSLQIIVSGHSLSQLLSCGTLPHRSKKSFRFSYNSNNQSLQYLCNKHLWCIYILKTECIHHVNAIKNTTLYLCMYLIYLSKHSIAMKTQH